MYRILLVVILLILYGSLYPFNFHSTQLAASPLWVLVHSWPPINRFLVVDIVVNVVIFIPVGVFGLLALRQSFPATFAATVIVLFALALSSSIEMIQLFDGTRECTASDVICNVSGAVLGVAIGYFYQYWLERFLARAETAAQLCPASTVLLFYIWLAYQGFPLFPDLHRARVAEKIRNLFAAVSVSPLETFTYFVEWFVAAQLLGSVLGAERARRFFPLALLLLPAKLLVVSRTITWSELSGAVLACIGYYFVSENQNRAAIASGLILSLLILRGLVPYHWSSSANPFSWIPFSGFLAADREFGVLTFLRKCFWYGSAVWLLRAAGWRLARATVAVTLLLGAIEIIQIHLPGRVAEITDPLLVLVLAATLGLLDRWRGNVWSSEGSS